MNYQVCTRCVMDTTASEITFDDFGVCNFCTQAKKALEEIALEQPYLHERLEQIKRDGEWKEYDCIIGLSGGVDSSTVLHQAVRMGLRPLAFSVENGWQSPEAQENIMKLVEGLKVPFYRYTFDLERFRELQFAFLKAGVPNAEIPTDHVLMAATYDLASKYGIKWIISGGNVATESIMPPSWGYNARDLVHMKAIYKWATGKRLKGIPLCSLWKWNWYRWVKRIKIFYLLDYIHYDREQAISVLEKQYGYKPYGEKHGESIFTKWFQNFYLFNHHGIDKRRAHLSSLIASGQMTREQAMEELEQKLYYPQLGFERFIKQKRSHDEFPKDEKIYQFIAKIVKCVS